MTEALVPTPRTDEICITPIMEESVTQHKWERLQDCARTLEREIAELQRQLAEAQEERDAWASNYRESQVDILSINRTASSLREQLAERDNGPTEEMGNAVRGILQVLRGRFGVSFHDVREHCKARGDNMNLWPTWALTEQGYLTDGAAASLIYSVMLAARPVAAAVKLRGDLEALQADALRWRFIRSSSDYAVSAAIQAMWRRVALEGKNYPSAEDWDSALDAAISKAKP